jgi:IS1 family transposase
VSEVGTADQTTSLNLFERVFKYNKVEALCTDTNPTYQSLMRYYGVEFSTKHHITKAETSLVESWNMRLRHYLARLKRKSLFNNISIEMRSISILMLLNKELVLSIV